MVSNKDVLAMTGGLGSLLLSIQTSNAEIGSDNVVTLIGGREEARKLDDLAERLKGKVTSSTKNASVGREVKREEEDRKKEEEAGDLLTVALQMPSRLDNIVDFDVRCRYTSRGQTASMMLVVVGGT